MIDRTTNPNATQYRYYGGKGVRICEQWLDFVVFRDWAHSHGYADHLTIERKDPSGNYEPANCEWITRQENARRGSRKLHRDTVLDIRRRHALHRTPTNVLAADHGIQRTAISRILRRKTYSTMPIPSVVVLRSAPDGRSGYIPR
jgi:hypothetical protein